MVIKCSRFNSVSATATCSLARRCSARRPSRCCSTSSTPPPTSRRGRRGFVPPRTAPPCGPRRRRGRGGKRRDNSSSSRTPPAVKTEKVEPSFRGVFELNIGNTDQTGKTESAIEKKDGQCVVNCKSDGTRLYRQGAASACRARAGRALRLLSGGPVQGQARGGQVQCLRQGALCRQRGVPLQHGLLPRTGGQQGLFRWFDFGITYKFYFRGKNSRAFDDKSKPSLSEKF